MANEKFKINGVVSEVVPIVGDTGDVLKKTVSGVEWGALDKATQAEAEAGTDDTKIMTPLKVKQVTEQFATKTELANIDLTEELNNRVRFITETQYDTLKTNNNIEANITYIVYK